MQNIFLKRFFRILSANHWNQPESRKFITQQPADHSLIALIFFSNAEKLRKITISKDQTALTSESQKG